MARAYNHGFTAVDLYSGSGSVTEGLKHVGFQVVAAIDNDPISCATYRENHKEVNLYEEDIRDVDPWDIRLNDLGGTSVDLLVICAPCQPFSSLNQKSGLDDRADLLLEGLRFIEVLQPRVVFVENVPGLAHGRYQSVLNKFLTGLNRHLYQYWDPIPVVNAADYGVPQRRLRTVLMATLRCQPPALPNPVTPDSNRVTVRQAIGDLPRLEAGESDLTDPLHFARRHRPHALERLAAIPKDGGSRNSLPLNLELSCHKGHKGHPDVYGRMAWDSVAPTLTTGCTDITRGRFAHPNADRAITLREAAILQTFPTSYRFKGNAGEIARQIGNAVPMAMIVAFGTTLVRGVSNQMWHDAFPFRANRVESENGH